MGKGDERSMMLVMQATAEGWLLFIKQNHPFRGREGGFGPPSVRGEGGGGRDQPWASDSSTRLKVALGRITAASLAVSGL